MNEQRGDALPPGARLDGGKYEIEEVLGGGGFGLVYRVRHLLLDEERAIKEYLPSEIAVREYAHRGQPGDSRSAGDPQGHGPAPCGVAHQAPGHIDLSAIVLHPATGRQSFPILCKSLARYR